jgi:two-component system nitrate/nitrite response regulator NarL
MILLLCSKNATVLEKWSSALSSKWQVYQAMSAEELSSILDRFTVDLILLHRNMLDTDQLNSLCAQSHTTQKVFVFSDRPDDSEGLYCLKIGCVGYANTYIRETRLKAAVEAVESGLVWVGGSLMRYMIKRLAAVTPKQENSDTETMPKQLSTLSKREYQIAKLVADGMANSDIANELDIAERTVKSHLSSIYSKTRTKGRLNLALLLNG